VRLICGILRTQQPYISNYRSINPAVLQTAS